MMLARFANIVLAVQVSFFAFPLAAAEPEQGDPAQGDAQQLDVAANKQPAGKENPPVQEEKKQTRIKLSKQTSRITQPLDDEGYVDYIKAINQRYGRGVTPQTNAAVVIVQILGLGDEDDDFRSAYCKQLGVAPPARDGSYFVSIPDFASRESRNDFELQDEIEAQLWKAQKGQWTNNQLPHAARWLKENTKHLDRLVAGIQRPRYYSPMVVAKESPALMAVSIPTLSGCRHLARGLTVRAMRHLSRGNVEAAQKDMLTCYRLARHFASGPTLIHKLVGMSIQNGAVIADQRIAASGKLTSKQLLTYRVKLEQLKPLPRTAEAMDIGERYSFLDAATHLARGNINVNVLNNNRLNGALTDALRSNLIDWNQPLILGNHWYDRMVAAYREPTYLKRRAAVDKVMSGIENAVDESKEPLKLAGRILVDGPPKALGQQLGKILLAFVLPATGVMQEAEARTDIEYELTRVALALAAYKADHQSYPESLDKLAPKYIAKVPEDFYTEKPLTYKLQEGGYKLYALGSNGKDNNGLTRNDGEQDLEADDIIVQVPHPTDDE